MEFRDSMRHHVQEFLNMVDFWEILLKKQGLRVWIPIVKNPSCPLIEIVSIVQDKLHLFQWYIFIFYFNRIGSHSRIEHVIENKSLGVDVTLITFHCVLIRPTPIELRFEEMELIHHEPPKLSLCGPHNGDQGICHTIPM